MDKLFYAVNQYKYFDCMCIDAKGGDSLGV
jgi:hypothetical protein